MQCENCKRIFKNKSGLSSHQRSEKLKTIQNFDDPINLLNPLIKKKSKTKIPKAMKTQVWMKEIGNKIIGECYICQREVRNDNFDCGHIIAEANGGKTEVENMRVVCGPCNKSCYTKNLEEFKKLLKTPNTNNQDQPQQNDTKISGISNDSKEKLIINVTNYWNMIKDCESRIDASNMLNAKINIIREKTLKFRENNKDATSYYIFNIENLIPNQSPSSMINMKRMSEMKKYYDDWFNDIKLKFMTFINNDENVVKILSECF
jgi:hypothetical protein